MMIIHSKSKDKLLFVNKKDGMEWMEFLRTTRGGVKIGYSHGAYQYSELTPQNIRTFIKWIGGK